MLIHDTLAIEINIIKQKRKKNSRPEILSFLPISTGSNDTGRNIKSAMHAQLQGIIIKL